MHRPTNPLPVFIQGGEPRTRFHGWRGNPSPDGCLPEGGHKGRHYNVVLSHLERVEFSYRLQVACKEQGKVFC
jgi:hypothetical protein